MAFGEEFTSLAKNGFGAHPAPMPSKKPSSENKRKVIPLRNPEKEPLGARFRGLWDQD